MSVETRDDADPSPDPIADSPLVRWAKVAIIVMGLLILVGFAFVAFEIWRRQTDPDYAERVREGRTPAVAATIPTGGLRLPAGARIVEQTALGDRLAVRVDLPDGGQSIFLVVLGGRSIDVREIVSAPTR